MHSKQARQARIRELLLEEVIDTHEKLARFLQGQQIEVSQSTLSKDLRELGVVRMPRPDGGFRYTVPEAGATLKDQHILERELRDYLVQVDRAQNMIVVKTLSGHAQSVCEAIDRTGWPEIMGTIAGENTIFILTKTSEKSAVVIKYLVEISGESV
jgi:transcriptional regulator of arginine metabolism